MAYALHCGRPNYTHRRILHPLLQSSRNKEQRCSLLLCRAHRMHGHLPHLAWLQCLDYQQSSGACKEVSTPDNHNV